MLRQARTEAEGSGHDDDVAIPFMPLVQPGDDSPRSARTELPQALAEQLEAVRAGRITRGNSSDGEPGSMSQLTFSTSSHRAQLAVLTQRLDTALEDVGEGIREAVQTQEVIVQAASLGMGGLSVGYVLWLLRSGTLFASMLTSLPAWKMMDPLPILDILEGQDEDSESLQSLIDRGQATLSEAAAE